MVSPARLQNRAAPADPTDMSQVALGEVLGGLSYALDITEGEPPGHAVRTTAIGMRPGEPLLALRGLRSRHQARDEGHRIS
jgi:hypothetical protein